ncbi:Dabb family protein [Clostridium pasteurianum]|uniref:Stress responsive A/B Barrel Domain-containing protein n=1 Tax=Clostridium pasteurianum BC1 TaxID=86416 RepID=R4K1A0_CLOPA|nr:Dabb family protein [Clostridium pasteurianum]AGK95511.1 Stress responsive A/B Barrel Domain-containing protein [Clostridium pasteurianum BC1]
MIINNLFIRLKERNNENIQKTRDVLLSMKGKIETLRDLKVEVDISQGDYDLMLITKYDSIDDLNTYLNHPVHVEVSKYIVSVLDKQVSFRYESLD